MIVLFRNCGIIIEVESILDSLLRELGRGKNKDERLVLRL